MLSLQMFHYQWHINCTNLRNEFFLDRYTHCVSYPLCLLSSRSSMEFNKPTSIVRQQRSRDLRVISCNSSDQLISTDLRDAGQLVPSWYVLHCGEADVTVPSQVLWMNSWFTVENHQQTMCMHYT